MENVIATQAVKGGGQTVFLDLKKASNDKVYLTLTTLGHDKDGADSRRSIIVWQDQLADFSQALALVMKQINVPAKSK